MDVDEDRSVVNSFYDAINSLMELRNQPNLKNSESKLESFKILLSAPKWNENYNLKQMAAQYIPLYIQYFTSLHEAAINAQLDLCEDDDIRVRKESVKNLPVFAKNVPKYASRLTDVLLQLLQSDDREELVTVSKALLLSFQQSPKDSTGAFFYQIENGTHLVRQQAFQFLDCHLLPLTAPGMKHKMLTRFLQLVESVSFSEAELDIVISLVSTFQMSGSISYNAQLDLLYKKKLEVMIQIPQNTTFEKISKVSKLYKPLFISGTSSFRFICFLASHVLNKSTLGTADQLNVLKLICDMLGFISELWSLCDVMPIFQKMLIELLPLISKTDPQIKLESLKLEPISYFLLFCRLKGPNVVRTNSLQLTQTLNKALGLAKHIKNMAAKNLEVIENGLRKEANEKILASCICAVNFIRELQKGPNVAQEETILVTSWNLPHATKVEPVILDKETEKKVAEKMGTGKKKLKKTFVSNSSKTANGSAKSKTANGSAKLAEEKTKADILSKPKANGKVGKRVSIKTQPSIIPHLKPKEEKEKVPTVVEIKPKVKVQHAFKDRKLSLGRVFTSQAGHVLKSSVAKAAEEPDSRLNAKIFSVSFKPALAFVSKEKREMNDSADREVMLVKRKFNLVKRQL